MIKKFSTQFRNLSYNKVPYSDYKNSKFFFSFLTKLLLSYSIVIIICISSMGLLSYKFVGNNIVEKNIKSNIG